MRRKVVFEGQWRAQSQHQADTLVVAAAVLAPLAATQPLAEPTSTVEEGRQVELLCRHHHYTRRDYQHTSSLRKIIEGSPRIRTTSL